MAVEQEAMREMTAVLKKMTALCAHFDVAINLLIAGHPRRDEMLSLLQEARDNGLTTEQAVRRFDG